MTNRIEKENARNVWVGEQLGVSIDYRDDADFITEDGEAAGFFMRDENGREVLIENAAPNRTIPVPVEHLLGIA
jgi:hypothetical protein